MQFKRQRHIATNKNAITVSGLSSGKWRNGEKSLTEEYCDPVFVYGSFVLRNKTFQLRVNVVLVKVPELILLVLSETKSD